VRAPTPIGIAAEIADLEAWIAAREADSRVLAADPSVHAESLALILAEIRDEIDISRSKVRALTRTTTR
jgi:hypothetical protein